MNGSVHNLHTLTHRHTHRGTHTHSGTHTHTHRHTPTHNTGHMCHTFFLTQFPQLSLYHSPTSATKRRGQFNIAYAVCATVTQSVCLSVNLSICPSVLLKMVYVFRLPYPMYAASTTRHVNFNRATDAPDVKESHVSADV